MDDLRKALAALFLFLFHSLCVCGGSDARRWTLDDFEDGNLEAASGPSWFALSDDLIGGASDVRIENRGRALALTGRLAGGKTSFAGAWVSLDRGGRTVDLTGFEGLRLRVKSRVPLEVGLRSGSFNYMAPIEPGPEWRLVEVPFTRLAPVGKLPDGTKFAGHAEVVGISTPQLPSADDRAQAPIDFEIDDVALYGSIEGAHPVPSGSPTGVTNAAFTPLAAIPKQGWIELAKDAAGDGRRPGLPDATLLETIPSAKDGLVWFRVTLAEPPHDRWIGANLALDVDGDPSNGRAWWGANGAFKFDRLVSVWCIRTGERCQGFVGAADAEQVGAGSLGDGSGQGVRFAIDRGRRGYVLGVPRETLGLSAPETRLVVAVGSALFFNDDVPGDGAATLR
jgi:hypothetical protein